MDSFEQEQADKQMLEEFVTRPRGGDPLWNIPVEHLSPSSLNTFMRCPEQWRRGYVLKLKEPPKIAMVLGTANHKALGYNYLQKIHTHEDLPVKTVVEFYHDHAVPETIEKDGGKTNIVGYDEDKLHRTGALMVEQYHREAAPTVQPVTVEMRHSITVPGVPVPVIGFVDVESDKYVVDVKTSSKKKTKVQESWVLQGRIYQLFRNLPVEWHVVTSTQTPAVYTPANEPGLSQPNSEEDDRTTIKMIQMITSQIQHMYDTYGPDETWPMTGIMSRACSWCGFTTCPSRKWAVGAS